MNKQFMQILEQIGPEAMLIIIQTLAQLDEQQLQALVQELQNMAQGGGQALPQQQMPPEAQRQQANANMFGSY